MYKYLIIFIFCSLNFSVCFSNSENEILWSEAQLQLENGDYTSAIENLQMIENYEERAELLQCLSYAYLKTGQIGNSIWAAEKGLQLDRGNKELKSLLKFAQQSIENPFPSTNSLLDSLKGVLSLPLVAITFLVSLMLTAYIIYIKIANNKSYWTALFFFIFIAIITGWLGVTWDRAEYGILIKKQEGYFDALNNENFVEREIPEGTKVEMMNEVDGKYKVVFSNGIIGLIEIEFVKLL